MLKPKTRIRMWDKVNECAVKGTIRVVNPAGDFTAYGVELDDGRYTTVLHVCFLQNTMSVIIPYKDGKGIRMSII